MSDESKDELSVVFTMDCLPAGGAGGVRGPERRDAAGRTPVAFAEALVEQTLVLETDPGTPLPRPGSGRSDRLVLGSDAHVLPGRTVCGSRGVSDPRSYQQERRNSRPQSGSGRCETAAFRLEC